MSLGNGGYDNYSLYEPQKFNNNSEDSKVGIGEDNRSIDGKTTISMNEDSKSREDSRLSSLIKTGLLLASSLPTTKSTLPNLSFSTSHSFEIPYNTSICQLVDIVPPNSSYFHSTTIGLLSYKRHTNEALIHDTFGTCRGIYPNLVSAESSSQVSKWRCSLDGKKRIELTGVHALDMNNIVYGQKEAENDEPGKQFVCQVTYDDGKSKFITGKENLKPAFLLDEHKLKHKSVKRMMFYLGSNVEHIYIEDKANSTETPKEWMVTTETSSAHCSKSNRFVTAISILIFLILLILIGCKFLDDDLIHKSPQDIGEIITTFALATFGVGLGSIGIRSLLKYGLQEKSVYINQIVKEDKENDLISTSLLVKMDCRSPEKIFRGYQLKAAHKNLILLQQCKPTLKKHCIKRLSFLLYDMVTCATHTINFKESKQKITRILGAQERDKQHLFYSFIHQGNRRTTCIGCANADGVRTVSLSDNIIKHTYPINTRQTMKASPFDLLQMIKNDGMGIGHLRNGLEGGKFFLEQSTSSNERWKMQVELVEKNQFEDDHDEEKIIDETIGSEQQLKVTFEYH